MVAREDFIQALKTEQKPENETDHKCAGKCKGPGEGRNWLFQREKWRLIWLEPAKEGTMAMDEIRK